MYTYTYTYIIYISVFLCVWFLGFIYLLWQFDGLGFACALDIPPGMAFEDLPL